MSVRMLGVAVAVAVLLLVAGALWAQYGTPGQMMAKPEGGMMPAAKEFDRCTMTCTLLMDNYQKKYASMRAHEGDKQCWQTCWSRMGKGSGPTMEAQKGVWMQNHPNHMRANQCAQGCWRINHDQSKEVAVGGWRSAPRDTVCAR